MSHLVVVPTDDPVAILLVAKYQPIRRSAVALETYNHVDGKRLHGKIIAKIESPVIDPWLKQRLLGPSLYAFDLDIEAELSSCFEHDLKEVIEATATYYGISREDVPAEPKELARMIMAIKRNLNLKTDQRCYKKES